MYQVLYRKYRPQIFADVVGQEHITETLAREVETGKLSHAYLFTGSRGTGKTTCAKILAKAVNCLHPVGGDPCGECEICRGIDSGAILDVVEIDAASNNGVDNIRDIRDESAFAPVSCRCRVYIIDEVHMLSIGAFNALLKTLEEPPEHVKFILATTEVHKLPVTILSRCQRFDFKRVSPEAMISRMQYIAGQEGFRLEDDAAILIARLADGGMRDALSTLDQCIGRSSHVTAELVSQVAGITGRDHLFALANTAAQNDAAGALVLLDRLHAASCDMDRLCADLILHFRNLMIVKTVQNAEKVLICTADELEAYRAQSAQFTLEALLYAMDALQTANANMKKGVNRRIELEMALLRLASPKLEADTKALLRRVAALELSLKTGTVPAVAQTAMPQTDEAEPLAAQPDQAQIKPPPVPEPESEPQGFEPEREGPNVTDELPAKAESGAKQPESDNSFDGWAQVLAALAEINRPLWGILMQSTAFLRGEFVLIKSENPAFASFIKSGSHARDIKEAVYQVTGKRYRLGIYSKPETPAADPKPQQDALAELAERAKQLGVPGLFE